jgi:hypothetical protein
VTTVGILGVTYDEGLSHPTNIGILFFHFAGSEEYILFRLIGLRWMCGGILITSLDSRRKSAKN